MRFHPCTVGTFENRIGIASKTGTGRDNNGILEPWVCAGAFFDESFASWTLVIRSSMLAQST
jgi:hypothetical protein